MADFTVAIKTGGSFACSKTPGATDQGIYVLSFNSPPDNRVTLPFIDAFVQALEVLEHSTGGKGTLIITSGISKFFSNGFDLEHTRSHKDFFERFIGLLRAILVYCMPTVALVNGHCFGAGVFLAMACDYRVQNPSKGFICLPEVDLGVPIPTSIAAMLKAKMPNLLVYRDAVIEGRRWTGEASHKAGLVDGVGGLDECLKFIKDRKLVEKSAGGVVAALKEDQYRAVLIMFEREKENVAWRVKMEEDRRQRAEQVAKKVKDWTKSQL